jgi:hypothetical protein
VAVKKLRDFREDIWKPFVPLGVRQIKRLENNKSRETKGTIMNFNNLLKNATLGLMTAGAIGLFGTSQSALAGYGQPGYQPRCHYETVIDYEIQTRSIVEWVTKYDHCGHPYRAKIVRYITVKVPVERLVKVCH